MVNVRQPRLTYDEHRQGNRRNPVWSESVAEPPGKRWDDNLNDGKTDQNQAGQVGGDESILLQIDWFDDVDDKINSIN